jgi:hypothetical protein
VLIAGALILVAFGLELLRQGGFLPEGGVEDIATLYVQLTLPPTALFVFIIAGVFTPPAPFLAGAALGLFDAVLITILVLLAPVAALEAAGITEVATDLLPLYAIAIVVGAVVTGVTGVIARYIIRAIRPPDVPVETPAWWPPGEEPGSKPVSGHGQAAPAGTCQECGAIYALGNQFCPTCGASLLPPSPPR